MTYEKHGALTYVRNFNATNDLSFWCLYVRKLRLFHNINLHHTWNIKSLASLLEV